MANLESIPEEILQIILNNISDDEILPIRFVSKKMELYTKGRVSYIYKIMKEINIFKWLCEIKYIDADKICGIIINQMDCNMEMMKWALESEYKINPDDHILISEENYKELYELGYVLDEYDPYIPKGSYKEIRKYICAYDDMDEVRNFIMEKAIEEIDEAGDYGIYFEQGYEDLKKKINRVEDVSMMILFADAYFGVY